MTYLAPGVYIEEVPSGPQPIAAAPTSVVAIVGTTERGPHMEPRRITGWGQYLAVFGATTSRGFTAESVFGFFENGGPAAYVVRVDPSTTAEWSVRDGTDSEVFKVRASSPGAWANSLQIAVEPDERGGDGMLYEGEVTATVKVLGVGSTDVAVLSTAGVAVGDSVIAVPAVGTAAAATVEAVTATTLRLKRTTGADVDLVPGDRVAGHAPAGATTLRLPAANGIREGDLLVAELPDRTRITALVASASNEGAGMVVTLAPGGLSAAVPGAQFAPRTDRFGGTVGALMSGSVALTAINWSDDQAVRPQPEDILSADYRAFAGNGLRGTWSAAPPLFQFSATPPPGAIEVEAAVTVVRYRDDTALVKPTLEDLKDRFPFVPDKTQLKLAGQTAPEDVTVTRDGDAFTTPDATKLAKTFKGVEFIPAKANDGVVVRCAREVHVNDFVDFPSKGVLRVTGVEPQGGNVYVLRFTSAANLSAVTGDRFVVRTLGTTRVFPLRFSLSVFKDGDTVESMTGLGLAATHPFYYFKDDQVNGRATTIRVTERDTTVPLTAASLPASVASVTGGTDGTAKPADYRAGFLALEAEPEPAMVICPETTRLTDPLIAADVIGAMVTHCQTFRRLAVVDAPAEADDQALVKWRNRTVASTYASVYAPHVQMVTLDPKAIEQFAFVPPSGFVAGVMARVDRTPPGVAKAPANEAVSGIVGLAQTYTQRRQDLLNPNAVNILRAFPGRGIRVWGARNATDDTQFRYTNVRRLFNAIETSIERGTQWVVFEPNTASTWLRVKVSVEGFLEQRWRAGELAGATPGEAFRVRVGLGETMTEDQVDLGLVIVEVAIAPAKPAEFVVFRFSHKRLSE